MSELPTASIKGLEIFATGKWNGDVYTEQDLDAMVNSFGQVGFHPFVKAGHQDGQESRPVARSLFGAPALGYVERLYRVGSKLLADIKDVPRRFADLIKAGAYKRISSEIYWNYSTPSGKFSRVLKAVAFLGAEIPALTDLKAIESLYASNSNLRVITYAFKQPHERSYGHMEDFTETLAKYNSGDQQAGVEVDALVKERIEKTGEGYTVALQALSRESKSYGQVGRPKDDIVKRYHSGMELDRRAKERMLSRSITYTQALREVMLADPELGSAYVGAEVRTDFARIPKNELNGIISGHEMEDGSWNWPMVLQAAKMRPDLCQACAQERIEELTSLLISNEGTPASIVNDPATDYRGTVRRRIRSEYPALAKASDNGRNLSEEALREIFWMKN